MDVEAGVQIAGDEGLAGVNADPYPDRFALPCVPGRAPLGIRRRQHGRARIGEGEVKGVAVHLHLDPAMSGDRLAEEAAVVLERPHVDLLAEILQQPRGALDIREDKGDRAARKLRHHQTREAYDASPPANHIAG